MFFSKSTGGIYEEAVHGASIPSDALCVPDILVNAFKRGEISALDVVDGSVVALAPPPPPAVTKITALQGLLVIDQSGLADKYDAWADDPARSFAERAFINKAQEWRRDDATLAGAAAALGLSDAQVDAMFELAATL